MSTKTKDNSILVIRLLTDLKTGFESHWRKIKFHEDYESRSTQRRMIECWKKKLYPMGENLVLCFDYKRASQGIVKKTSSAECCPLLKQLLQGTVLFKLIQKKEREKEIEISD